MASAGALSHFKRADLHQRMKHNTSVPRKKNQAVSVSKL